MTGADVFEQGWSSEPYVRDVILATNGYTDSRSLSFEGVRLSHGWSGYVAFTRQWLPSLGVHDGIHYAAGYCGSGVAMAPYLGYRIAHRLLGGRGPHGLRRPVPALPLAFAMPGLMPAATLWHRLKDGAESA